MAIWRRQFVPGAEVVALDDGWRGIVQEQRRQHVVAIAIGFKPNDDLAGYRYISADTLTSLGGGEHLDRRTAPTEIVWCRKQPKSRPLQARSVWQGVGARSRPPTP